MLASCTAEPPPPQTDPVAQIELGTSICDFGEVSIGAIERCDVTVGNVGESLLMVAMSVSSSSFSVLPATAEVLAGESATAVVTLVAPPPGLHEATLSVSSNDNDNPLVEVELLALVHDAPTCVAQVSSINDVAIEGTEASATVGDAVAISLAGSLPVDRISRYAWALVEIPAESEAEISSPEDAIVIIEPDVEGTFVLCGQVTDIDGLASTNECCVSIEVGA